MTIEQTTIVGMFHDSAQAVEAIEALRKAGFHDDQLGFAVRTGQDPAEANSAPTETEAEPSGHGALSRGIVGGVLGAADALLLPITGPADASTILGSVLPVAEEAIDKLPYPGSHTDKPTYTRPDTPMRMPDTTDSSHHHHKPHREPNPSEGEHTGAITGGVVGGILGAAASLLLPGIGPVIAGGVLLSTLGSIAIGGLAGSFLGTFVGMGVPEEKAHYYEQEFAAGRTIVTIHPADRQQEAMDLLRRYGAYDVQSH